MNIKKPLLFKIIGILLCVLPAAVTALTYFPLWMQSERSAVSVLSVAVLALCAIPARRVIARTLRSPSAWQFWGVMWIALTMLNAISEGLRAVSAVAFPTSLLGAVFFRLGSRAALNEEKADKEDKHDK